MASSPDMLIKNRFLGFLIWQSIPSTIIFFFFRAFFSSISSVSTNSSTSDAVSSLRVTPWLIRFLSFFTFHLSQLLFSASLSLLASPQLDRPASPLQLALWLLRFVVVLGTGGRSSLSGSADFRRRVRVSLSFVMFVMVAAVSGFLAITSVYWVKSDGYYDGEWVVRSSGLKGFAMGLFYGLFYIYKQRWVIEFPIIQRPPFFSFKMGLSSAVTLALKLLVAADLFSTAVVVFLPIELKSGFTFTKFITERIIIYVGSFAVFLCWELSHHLHRVLHTKRFTFAPPKGSAAAETNPSEDLLVALEASNPRSLLQYLAYLDLCMVCENNVDTWRRAAFFEETGETYKRVIAVCLRPLEQITAKLDEGLGGTLDKASQLSKQLRSPNEFQLDPKYYESLNEFQLYAWCARAVGSLTSRSRNEDRFGVAQLSGSNAFVISTLLSCLLAVETLMGKKTNIQSPHHLSGPAGIKWATQSTRKVDVAVNKRKGPQHSKAYAMADVLRTSIYQIVSTFHDEMVTSAKANLLDRDWIISSKPLFGTHELLVLKLEFFLDFRAT